MKLLLTSNGFFTDEIKKRFLELVGGETDHKSAAIITTASPMKESNPFAIKAKGDLTDMGFGSVEFLDVEFEKPESLLRKTVIYINGGNPFGLLYHNGNHQLAHNIVRIDPAPNPDLSRWAISFPDTLFHKIRILYKCLYGRKRCPTVFNLV